MDRAKPLASSPASADSSECTIFRSHHRHKVRSVLFGPFSLVAGFASLVVGIMLGFLSGILCGVRCGSVVLPVLLMLVLLGSIDLIHEDGPVIVGQSSRALPLCILHARMASLVGAIRATRYALLSAGGKACTNSGSTDNMLRKRSFFLEYTPLTDRYICCDNGQLMGVKGEGLYAAVINGRTCHMARGLHVPDIDVNLLLTRVHCRRGRGCSFVADKSGCFLMFPKFAVKVNDMYNCLFDFSLVCAPGMFDYDKLAGSDGGGGGCNSRFFSRIGRAHLMHRVSPLYNLLSLHKEPEPAEATFSRPNDANWKWHLHLRDLTTPTDPDWPKEVPVLCPCKVVKSHLPAVCRFTRDKMFAFFGGRRH